jgi:hypothetical protein
VVATGSVNWAMRSLLERFGVRPLKGLAVPAAADRATSRNTREVFPVSPKPRKVSSYCEFGARQPCPAQVVPADHPAAYDTDLAPRKGR